MILETAGGPTHHSAPLRTTPHHAHHSLDAAPVHLSLVAVKSYWAFSPSTGAVSAVLKLPKSCVG